MRRRGRNLRLLLIVVFDFRDCGKRNFYYLTGRGLDFYAGRRQRLRRFHASNCTADTPAVRGYDFYIALAI